MGPATEPAVAISAISSLALFSCYFAHVLVGVPQHWGVPYKDRLSRHLQSSVQGRVVEILNAIFSLATCVLFILETYEYGSNYNFIVRSFSLELAFNGFFLCNFLLHLYLAAGKLAHLVSLQALVDITTVFPSYLLLFIDDASQTSSGHFTDVYLGLKVTRVIRVARLLVTISVFVQESSLAFDHSRQVLVLRSQFVRWSLKTLVVLFILAGLTNFLVEVQHADWGSGYGNMPFHDALYYIVVSFSTVGYGDISPSTPLSRLLITALILSLFFCAPLVTNALINLTRLTPKHGGRLSKSWGTGHIVVGCDSSCLRVVSVLLRELLAPDSMAYHTAHVVVVVPQEPTLAWEALLCLQPSFAVTYLTGDLSSAEDLRRARVGNARACFVLSDRLAADTEAQDKTSLMRALCAHQASPPGAPVLCLMTHSKSKRRLVRLGLPEAGVVCYDDVMEALVAHTCLQPGFSTVWAGMLSCMPEAEHLLKARAAQQDVPRSPEAAIVFETEGEYLRSLQRVMIRFRLDAFTGECAGDVAVELHRECGCTLFALICSTASSPSLSFSSSGEREGDRRRDTLSREQRIARVHPDYGEVLRDDDVGVFIGANHMAGDVIARYCATRAPARDTQATNKSTMSTVSTVSTGRSDKTPWQPSWWRNRQRVVPGTKIPKDVDGAEPQRQLSLSRSPSSGGPSRRPQEGRTSLPPPPHDDASAIAPFSGGGSGSIRFSGGRSGGGTVGARGSRRGSSTRRRSTTSRRSSVIGDNGRSIPLCGGGGGGACERTVWSQLHGSGHLVPSISPGGRLAAPPPGVVLVIAQSLSFALGVIIALCDADVDFEGGSSAVTVLCPPAWWDLTVDGLAERELAERFPSVRLHKEVAECSGLLECGIGGADLVCIVSSRVSQNHGPGTHLHDPMDSNGGGGLGFGDHSGRGQGSDGWAMGVVVDVLGLAPASTRVVVRFDDSTSAEQHQVVSAHVRRRAAVLEREQRERAWEHLEEDGVREEKGEGEAEVDKAPVLASLSGSSSRETTWWRGSFRNPSGTFARQGSLSDSTRGPAVLGVFFDDTRGVVHEGFHDFFATMSGYASGDVVVGNAAELLLLQTMLAPDIQSVMSDVLDLACRVPIETLWPGDLKGGGRGAPGRSRPPTYGEAYKTLLQDRDLLALGVHRPPTGRRRPTDNGPRGGGPAVRLWPSVGRGSDNVDAGRQRGAAAADKRRRCPGGSRYVAINCPSAGFILRDGDCLFVLRRPDKGVIGAEPVIAPAIARAIARAELPSSGTALVGKGALEGLREVDGEWNGAGPREP